MAYVKDMSLDDFMKSSIRNSHVYYPGLMACYLRKGARFLEGEMKEPVLDLAAIESVEKGKGTFKDFVSHLREAYPEYWLYAENVLNDRLLSGLLRMGFVCIEDTDPPCFYMRPVK